MARQLWGTYSVADHCTAFPFVADMLLYDRLIVPVPPDGDDVEWQRWAGKQWRPDRQRMLLAELGDYVRRVPWTADLRGRWARMGRAPATDAVEREPEVEDSAAFAATDLEMTARGESAVRQGRPDPSAPVSTPKVASGLEPALSRRRCCSRTRSSGRRATTTAR